MISEQVIEQIAAANDIVDVIGSYFPLKRAGPAYKAICPFHQEKSPSFTVNPARQMFKCFGCGAGGGVFKFVELYENVNFPEAAKRLAARTGITIVEEELSVEEDIERRMRQRLLALHADAAEWFHTNLLRTKAGQIARDYLKGRGLTVDVAKSWKLGYAPDAWDALTRMARDRGYRDEEILASGLVTFKEEEESGGRPQHFYDRFRDRLMFPICNDLGEVIAFSGRVLNAEAFGGKYVNSPETPLFIKGNVLFGIHKTKRAIIEKGAAIVCEGQIDLITAFESGVKNVTAPQGTAFTERQARILKRFADEVVLCFDSDAAGLKAAERSLPHLLEAGLSIRVAEMPTGHDPDSLIRTEGAEAFSRQIEAARDFFEFQIERSMATPEFATPKGKAAFANKMAESVALIPNSDAVLREAVINNISARLEISAAQFTALLNKTRIKPAWKSAKEAEESGRIEPLALTVTTRLLCQLAILSSEARAWLLSQEWQPLFSTAPDAELLTKVMAAQFDISQPSSVSAFLATLPPEEQSALVGLLDERQLPADPLRAAADCWRDLVRQELERQRNVCAARLRSPNLVPEEAALLQNQILELQQQLTALRG